MKKVALEHAVGEVLGHDVTEVNLQQGRKGVAFKRGHVIAQEDLAILQQLGKRHIYVWEGTEDEVHEDDAARVLAPMLAGQHVRYDAQPHEGKIGFYATVAGIFKVDTERLQRINALAIPSLPTIHNNFPVVSDKQVAAFRIIPLSCAPAVLDKVRAELDEALFSVKPYRLRRAAILVTGSEVHSGIIQDDFTPRLRTKLQRLGVEVVSTEIVPDHQQTICTALQRAIAVAELILVTGGTSVDPDDLTVQAMQQAGVDFPFQGNPIQPGNNMTIGYAGETTVCAVPAAALFFAATALDIFLPRLLAADPITPQEIARSGHGGLCHFCPKCVYPICPFGKGA
ncbi:MAG: molybdopterin-binding protein [Desulfuromonadaceae bacterium]|nr:molybdopterin-binding protein [Desulfuromonadaceae bacterium]